MSKEKMIFGKVIRSISLGAVGLGLTLSLFAEGNNQKSPENLVVNGGFEDWIPRTPPPGEALPSYTELPFKWETGIESSERQSNPNFELKGALFKDTKVKHGDETSLRIENGLPTDTTVVYQIFFVDPNVTYQIRCWIKGEDITPNPKDGCGAMIWANWGPKDFWRHQHSTAKIPEIKKGTFDWQEVTFTVDTGEDADLLKIEIQLRRAAGKIWYDDIEVVRVGEIKPVKSY